MSFLDNLENSLKSLESRDERDPHERERQQQERSQAVAAAPWAAKLKESAYTKALFDEAAVAGHRLRTKVYMAWFDSILRFEARERRLELRPMADGIVAVFIETDGETKTQPLDLNSSAADLMKQWLG
jgi:hypothetical protein